MPPPIVQTGLDVLARDGFAPLRGLRIGLVTNQAAVDARFRHAADLLATAPRVRLVGIFGPEHGFAGDAPGMIGVPDAVHPRYGCPIHTLYGETVESLRPREEALRGMDALVIDLPDVGCRSISFLATLLLCLEAGADEDLPIILLDRPNPLNGIAVEGPSVQPGYDSVVGPHPLPIRHGMTLGELALLMATERKIRVALHVVPCEGWDRSYYSDETILPWVLPAPHLPTLETLLRYPGLGLLEGTNLSDGQGTTRPYEICGAPWVDPDHLAERLQNEGHPGALFRPISFRPSYHKFAGLKCGGVQLHITDRESFQPVRTGFALLAALREEDLGKFRWRSGPFQFVEDKLAFDVLIGSSRERMALQAGLALDEITRPWAEEELAFKSRRSPHLLY